MFPLDLWAEKDGGNKSRGCQWGCSHAWALYHLPLGSWTAWDGPGEMWSSSLWWRRGLKEMGPWSWTAPHSIPGQQGLFSWSSLLPSCQRSCPSSLSQLGNEAREAQLCNNDRPDGKPNRHIGAHRILSSLKSPLVCQVLPGRRWGQCLMNAQHETSNSLCTQVSCSSTTSPYPPGSKSLKVTSSFGILSR